MDNSKSEVYSKVIDLMYEIGQTLSIGRDIREVLPLLLKIMSDTMGMEKGMLTILNRETGEIFVEDGYGLTDEERERGRYRLGEGITGKVVATGEPAVIPKISEEPMFLDKTGSHAKMSRGDISFICVPIKCDNEVIGTISADRYFGENISLSEDVKILSFIGMFISQAVRIHRIRHEEDVLEEENKRLSDELIARFRPKNIIGNSSAMLNVYSLIEKIASAKTTVLILGESGVGKELVASAIHYRGAKTKAPFITCNCAAIPEDIAESELFGHEKGAFTGAHNERKGRFELAEGGTIFLDEIGELSLPLQAKLLRVLQERKFERVGGSKTISIDVRIIAATNRRLDERVKEGAFREDLYYRLNVFPINVPSLRERKSDIPLLADYFVDKYSKASGKRILRISTPAIDMLMSYHWPGNVRELENCIERAVILSDDGVIHGYHLPPTLQTGKSSNTETLGSLTKRLDAYEREIVAEALKAAKGNMAIAAKELGISERMMGLRVRKYGIDFMKYRAI